MNLIDKDKLLHTLNKKLEVSETYDNEYCNGSADAYETAIRLIESAEIVEERKHAHWENKNDVYFCSACNEEAYWDTDYGQQLFDFCPNCGARMDEVEQ